MQPCNRIHYSKIYWRINMFRAHTAHHQDLQTEFAASGLYTHVVTGSCPGWVETRGCKCGLELLMISAMPLETCWAFNKFWNDKFYLQGCILLVAFIIISRCTDSRTSTFSKLNILVFKYYLIHTLTLRWLMSYIYGAPILDVSRSHTTTQHSR
jgi:hypothetical protein